MFILQINTIYEEYKNLKYNQRTHFLIIDNKTSIEIHTLEAKIDDITLDNVHQTYFVFYNISHSPKNLGSQLRNYVLFILLTW